MLDLFTHAKMCLKCFLKFQMQKALLVGKMWVTGLCKKLNSELWDGLACYSKGALRNITVKCGLATWRGRILVDTNQSLHCDWSSESNSRGCGGWRESYCRRGEGYASFEVKCRWLPNHLTTTYCCTSWGTKLGYWWSVLTFMRHVWFLHTP